MCSVLFAPVFVLSPPVVSHLCGVLSSFLVSLGVDKRFLSLLRTQLVLHVSGATWLIQIKLHQGQGHAEEPLI